MNSGDNGVGIDPSVIARLLELYKNNFLIPIHDGETSVECFDSDLLQVLNIETLHDIAEWLQYDKDAVACMRDFIQDRQLCSTRLTVRLDRALIKSVVENLQELLSGEKLAYAVTRFLILLAETHV